MGWRAQLLAHGSKATTIVLTSAAIVVGLLNGACGSSGSYYVEPSGHCWRPGVCHEVTSSALCSSAESFEDGDCASMLRVGDCVRADGGRVHLYAPLHGLLTPDCDSLAGTGARYEPD